MIRSNAYALLGLFLAGTAMAQTALNKTPAARVHVREEGGVNVRYTSKLATVVELNFTFGFDHAQGKASITAMLDKIKTDYAVDGKEPFVIKRFVGPNKGADNGIPSPVFTLADLNGAEVIVDNNISNLNQLPSKSSAMGTAFETAVRGGKSVVGFHGSGDGGTGWTFYTEELHPVAYNQHGNRTPAPIYKNEPESSHVATQGVLATGTKKSVPMGVEGGTEVLKTVTTRDMTNEWYRFGRNLLTDAKYGPLTTCLLKYDYRPIATSDLATQYRYPGGNPYVWMVKINNGRAIYLPPGHDATETTQGTTSFDGGTGDFERMFAQTLFYMAGYTKEPCGGTVDCANLPIVDAKDRMTGRTVGPTGVISFDRDFAFRNLSGKPYSAKLMDIHGRTIEKRNGTGNALVEFQSSHLKPGVYVLSVKAGKGAAEARRFVVSPSK